MAGWGYGAVIGAALLAAALVLWQRRQSRKILENLGKMLEAAMEGNFTEDSFDESLLSALESSFAHYLAASTVSARKVDAEKEKLKALIGDISHQTKNAHCQYSPLYPAAQRAAGECGLSGGPGGPGGPDQEAPKPH